METLQKKFPHVCRSALSDTFLYMDFQIYLAGMFSKLETKFKEIEAKSYPISYIAYELIHKLKLSLTLSIAELILYAFKLVLEGDDPLTWKSNILAYAHPLIINGDSIVVELPPSTQREFEQILGAKKRRCIFMRTCELLMSYDHYMKSRELCISNFSLDVLCGKALNEIMYPKVQAFETGIKLFSPFLGLHSSPCFLVIDPDAGDEKDYEDLPFASRD